MTDAAGGFAVDNLPEGLYSLEARKAGLITGAYGQSVPEGVSRLLSLSKERRSEIAIRMWRYGSVRGTVSGANRDGLVGVDVVALRRTSVSGRAKWVAGVKTSSDDRGVFELFPLRPGDYAIVAQVRPGASASIPPPGAGTYVPAVVGAGGSTGAALTVSAGTTIDGVSLVLETKRPGALAGTVSILSRPAQGVTVEALPGVAPEGLGGVLSRTAISDELGRFSLRGLVPGPYLLRARKAPPPREVARVISGLEMHYYASQQVIVTDGKPVDVALTLQEATRATGKLAPETLAQIPAAALSSLTIRLVSPDGERDSVASAPVNSRGEFLVPGVQPGSYLVRVGSLPNGWYFKSATIGGREASDEPQTIQSAESGEILIRLSPSRTSIGGRVLTDQGAGPPAVVAVFPVEERLWTDFGSEPRRLQRTVARADGNYGFFYLPAGQYFVVAVADLEPEWRDPRVLTALRARATRVRINEGEVLSQDLSVPVGATIPRVLSAASVTATLRTLFDRRLGYAQSGSPARPRAPWRCSGPRSPTGCPASSTASARSSSRRSSPPTSPGGRTSAAGPHPGHRPGPDRRTRSPRSASADATRTATSPTRSA